MEFYLDPHRYQGRPADTGRSEQELRCYDFLDRLQIPYDRVDHDPAFHLETCHQVEGLLGATVAKNLFLCNRQKTQFYLLIMPPDKPFQTKYLSRQLGCSRLSFADPQDLERLLGVQPGSASLLGLLFDTGHQVQPVLDRPVLQLPYLGLHPCRNTSTLRIRMSDVLERLLPALGYTAPVVELPEENP